MKSITDTQSRLIIGLKNTIQKGKNYLLDGHYCLFNSNNEIINILVETFHQINHISLNLILGDISEIKNKLEERDKKPYNYHLLELMQKKEQNYAKSLSKKLGVALNIGSQKYFSKLLASLRKIFYSK